MMGFMRAASLLLVLGTVATALGQEEPVAESVKSKTPIDTTPIAEAPITDGDRAHWAFAPVVRPLCHR